MFPLPKVWQKYFDQESECSKVYYASKVAFLGAIARGLILQSHFVKLAGEKI